MSTTKFYNFSRSTTFILVVSPSEVVYEIWIQLCRVLDLGHTAKLGYLPCVLICFAMCLWSGTQQSVFEIFFYLLQFLYHSICSTILCLHNFVTICTLLKWLNNSCLMILWKKSIISCTYSSISMYITWYCLMAKNFRIIKRRWKITKIWH